MNVAAHDWASVESVLGVTLRPSQREIVQFFLDAQQAGHGCVAAAEMGLGKTVIAGACIQLIRILLDAEQHLHPVLVVVPLATVTPVWKAHLVRWFREKEICIYHGAKRDSAVNLSRAKHCRVLLTTYEVVTQHHRTSLTKLFREAPRTRKPFNLFCSRYVFAIVDEAHFLRNGVQFDDNKPESRGLKQPKLNRKTGARKAPLRAKAMYAMRKQLDHAPLALTGTPVSNSLSDAAALAKLVAPLDESQPKPRWADMLVWKREIQGATTVDQKRQRVAELTRPFMIRKSKEDADAPRLPPVHHTVVELELTKAQLARSAKLVRRGLRELDDYDRATRELQDQPRNSGAHQLQVDARRRLRNTFGELRQTSDTSLLPDADLITDPTSIGRRFSVEELLVSSCKATAAVPLVRDNVVTKQGKQVIFLHSKPMLRLLQRCLERSLPKYERVLCIDGDVSRQERDVVLGKFRQPHASGYNILLMTIHCGNVGIDLSVANHVLLPTPAFNTTLEQQAIDRLHRFPQANPVHVVRYLAGRTSVDGYVRQIQQRKLRNVVQVAVPDVRSTGFEDLTTDKEDLPTDFAIVREFFRSHLS